jgi:transposase InsO family protein
MTISAILAMLRTYWEVFSTSVKISRKMNTLLKRQLFEPLLGDPIYSPIFRALEVIDYVTSGKFEYIEDPGSIIDRIISSLPSDTPKEPIGEQNPVRHWKEEEDDLLILALRRFKDPESIHNFVIPAKSVEEIEERILSLKQSQRLVSSSSESSDSEEIYSSDDPPTPTEDQHKRVGRPQKQVDAEASAELIKYVNYMHTGYQRGADALQSSGIQISEWDARKVYKENNLYRFCRKQPVPNPHTQRFRAKFAGQIWHTDLHDWLHNSPDAEVKYRYIIAFLDDRTRYLIHLELLTDKQAITTAESMVRALQKVHPPHTLTSDNGKEFVGGDFQKVLAAYNIEHWLTEPNTPEQNGKIERFWQTFEGAQPTTSRLDLIIHEYNCVWKHSAIKRYTGRKTTPEVAWITEPKWEVQRIEEIGTEDDVKNEET